MVVLDKRVWSEDSQTLLHFVLLFFIVFLVNVFLIFVMVVEYLFHNLVYTLVLLLNAREADVGHETGRFKLEVYFALHIYFDLNILIITTVTTFFGPV